jgi:hypothetical protein
MKVTCVVPYEEKIYILQKLCLGTNHSAVRSMLMSQQYMLNKVLLNINPHKTRLWTEY